MPIHVTMADPRQPESPTPAGDRRTPEVEPMSPEDPPSTGSDEVGITPEQLARVIQRMETGFYDQAEIREQIARRALDDLDP